MSVISRPMMAARVALGLIPVVLMLSVTGCATRPNPDPRDPFESFNRGMFGFNDALDRAIVKPVATVYRDLTPRLVRTGVTNFFGNLEDAWSFVNSALQGKGQAAASSFMRLSINSTMGLGGILDVASDMRLERQREDFGQTLGWWGMPAGPYLVLPILGSSTVRDTIALPVDFQGDLVAGLNHIPTRNQLKVLDLLDTRTGLLSATAALDEAALDKYSFTRDAFLQRRINAVFDGNPPTEGAPAKPASR